MTPEAVPPGQIWSHSKGDFGPWFVVAVSQTVGTGQMVVTYRMTNDSSTFWTRPLDNFRELGLTRRR
jgi:hypothetical protein